LLYLKLVKLKNNMEGLGDVVEVIAKSTGVTKIVERVTKGKDCGCNARKQKLNKLFPFHLNKN
jgi:hypothetical protein